MGRVEFYAFDGATAAWKRLTTAPTAVKVVLFSNLHVCNYDSIQREEEGEEMRAARDSIRPPLLFDPYAEKKEVCM